MASETIAKYMAHAGFGCLARLKNGQEINAD